MTGKIEKVPRLYPGNRYFMDGITFHNGGVPVNQNAAHIIAHKGKAGAVNACMGFSAPAVLGAQVCTGIMDNGCAKLLLFGRRKAADRAWSRKRPQGAGGNISADSSGCFHMLPAFFRGAQRQQGAARKQGGQDRGLYLWFFQNICNPPAEKAGPAAIPVMYVPGRRFCRRDTPDSPAVQPSGVSVLCDNVQKISLLLLYSYQPPGQKFIGDTSVIGMAEKKSRWSGDNGCVHKTLLCLKISNSSARASETGYGGTVAKIITLLYKRPVHSDKIFCQSHFHGIRIFSVPVPAVPGNCSFSSPDYCQFRQNQNQAPYSLCRPHL